MSLNCSTQDSGGDMSSPADPEAAKDAQQAAHSDPEDARSDTPAVTVEPGAEGADPDISTCPNCGEFRPGPHCAWCGQNDRDYRRSSWLLVSDFFRETFELDSKLFRTLKLLLLKPGRLSAEFSRNRRASYVSPIRLYLFSSVIYLFAVSQVQSGGAASGAVETGQSSTPEEIDAPESASSSLVPTEAQIAYLRAMLPPRSVRRLDEILGRRDGPELVGAYLLFAGDMSAKDPEAASLAERVLWASLVDLLYDPGMLQNQVFGISLGLVFLVPVQALMLALVYYRKKRYFAEHLVLQFHMQTFGFFAASAMLVFPTGLVGSLATLVLSAWILYYLVASMRHFYEDSWMRTLFKVFLLCVLYMVVFTPLYFAVVAAGM